MWEIQASLPFYPGRLFSKGLISVPCWSAPKTLWEWRWIWSASALRHIAPSSCPRSRNPAPVPAFPSGPARHQLISWFWIPSCHLLFIKPYNHDKVMGCDVILGCFFCYKTIVVRVSCAACRNLIQTFRTQRKPKLGCISFTISNRISNVLMSPSNRSLRSMYCTCTQSKALNTAPHHASTGLSC